MAATHDAGAYRGRFAPSPTGPLHFGSLVAAVASYLRARAKRGVWLLRIEDIDPPREVAGAADRIIHALTAHGLRWDRDVIWQSASQALHQRLLDRLIAEDQVYACRCSREEIRATARQGLAGPVYPGTCRDRGYPLDAEGAALRLRTHSGTLSFSDKVQGHISCDVATDIGDLVIRRKDGLIAYALAVIADDSDQAITEVVRGCDLLPLTPAQIYLQRSLGLQTPDYLHIPTAVDGTGAKLSKQHGATPVNDETAAANLRDCLAFLGLDPPQRLGRSDPASVLEWARTRWDTSKIPRQRTRRAPSSI